MAGTSNGPTTICHNIILRHRTKQIFNFFEGGGHPPSLAPLLPVTIPANRDPLKSLCLYYSITPRLQPRFYAPDFSRRRPPTPTTPDNQPQNQQT